jgi:hypothetical protein
VLGADDGGEANLTYTWVATGPAAVLFSANGTNAAKNTTATFAMSGSYAFTVTITDSGGLSTTSTVAVTVNQTLSQITVTPASVTLSINQTQQFMATALDQFGLSMKTQPSFTWSKVSGAGGIDSTGLYKAPTSAGGSAVIRATSGGVSGTAAITVQFTIPVAPSSLAAAISNGAVLLTWQDNSLNEAGFHVQRSTNGTTWSTIASVAANTTSYTTALPPSGKTYYFRVIAYNAAGSSAASNTVSVTHTGVVGAAVVLEILSGRGKAAFE